MRISAIRKEKSALLLLWLGNELLTHYHKGRKLSIICE
jgi:hypothetical protein